MLSSIAVGGVYVPIPGALMDVWSADLVHEALPKMHFASFAVMKDELLAQPGDTIRFRSVNDVALDLSAMEITEDTNIQEGDFSTSETLIQVREYGYGMAVTERLTVTSYMDVFGEMALQLGRNYAQHVDLRFRDAALACGNTIFAGGRASRAAMVGGTDYFTTEEIRVAVEQLQSNSVPKISVPGAGDVYVAIVHPHQLAYLKRDPDWVAAQHYFGTRAMFTGEAGTWEDVIFLTTSLMPNGATSPAFSHIYSASVGGGAAAHAYQSILFGDNFYGWARALPVELRLKESENYQRRHGLAWYEIAGYDLLNHSNGVVIETV